MTLFVVILFDEVHIYYFVAKVDYIMLLHLDIRLYIK